MKLITLIICSLMATFVDAQTEVDFNLQLGHDHVLAVDVDDDTGEILGVSISVNVTPDPADLNTFYRIFLEKYKSTTENEIELWTPVNVTGIENSYNNQWMACQEVVEDDLFRIRVECGVSPQPVTWQQIYNSADPKWSVKVETFIDGNGHTKYRGLICEIDGAVFD